MGKESGISWTHATYNPWWGCVKVSEACDRCYAETWSKKLKLDVWGKDAPRRFFGEKHWNEPRVWNRAAEKEGIRKRVFCASMADVFEKHADLDPWREKLWKLIEETPSLDWLLLTKRTSLATDMVPSSWAGGWPKNVWAGTTTENQHWYDQRVPVLMKIPAAIHWLSMEPLLSAVDLHLDAMEGKKPDWFIVGGESGVGSRPMEAGWITSLRSQVETHGKAFFFKQKGEILAKAMGCKAKKGDEPSEWPVEFNVQNFPKVA